MDIDSSPVPRRQQHTCNNLLSVSPSSSVMEFVSEQVVTSGTAAPVTTAPATVSKKCTCPYERPTLKTMEAAAAAGHLYQMSSQSAHLPLSAGAAAAVGAEKVLVELEEDIRNANVTHLEDNLNNNNTSNITNISGNCDNTRSGDDKDVNSNPSIITVQAVINDNVVVVGGRSEQPVKEEEKKKKSIESVDELKKKKKSSDSSSSGKKKQSSSDDNSRCSCSEVQLRVKAAESPPTPKSGGMGRSSLNDGILSNCLSALNFVSGNRIGGGSDSKLGSSSSNSNGIRSPRSSKSHKSSSSADSLGE